MIKQIPTHLELKYKPTIGWYVNVSETYPPDLISGWATRVAYPMMKKRIAQLPKGDLREHMQKALPNLFAGKVQQFTTARAFDIFKSNQKQTPTLYHYN